MLQLTLQGTFYEDNSSSVNQSCILKTNLYKRHAKSKKKKKRKKETCFVNILEQDTRYRYRYDMHILFKARQTGFKFSTSKSECSLYIINHFFI